MEAGEASDDAPDTALLARPLIELGLAQARAIQAMVEFAKARQSLMPHVQPNVTHELRAALDETLKAVEPFMHAGADCG